MALIRPFRGLRPSDGRAEEVVAPPYDVLNRAEASQRAEGRPWSFLHISRAEIDLPADVDVHADIVYQTAAANLARMIEAGVLVRDPEPCYYIYRLTMGEHTQTGLVAAAAVSEYDSNRIRRHEFTRPDKENDRVRQIDVLNAQTGPVLLAYPSSDSVDALINNVTTGVPAVDLVADDGVGHVIWVVSDRAVIDEISDAFDRMSALYIADGHHRSAAASRVAASRRGGHSDAAEYFLTVIFPHKQMRIFDYNRVVCDLNGLSNETFLERIATSFSVTAVANSYSPVQPGEFGMYLAGQWYRLRIEKKNIPADPVGRLDVSLLADKLLEPVLGISDPRRDPRIEFIGGIRGLGELAKRVDSGDMAVAFSLYPTSMDDLIAVADAGKVMPPKSTWFEPKLADGLVSLVID